VALVAAFEVTPIGWVRSSRAAPDDDDWDAVTSQIVLDEAQFGTESLAELESFSHIEVVFVFDQVEVARIERGSRHPRGNPEWPAVGIFAQRGKARPNRLGVTACRLDRVDGLSLHVTGLDAIDGTPVLDVKPVMSEFLPRGDVVQPTWSHELMADYWTRS
jgi:tRNA (Thr-GGU) A37 N-methylase